MSYYTTIDKNCQILFFLGRRRRPANIGLTFKAWPERSEGLAWFLRDLLAKTMTKGFIRLKQLLDCILFSTSLNQHK